MKHLHHLEQPIGRPLLYLCGDRLWLGFRPDATLEWGNWMTAFYCMDLFAGGFDTVEFEFSVSMPEQSVEGVGFVGSIEMGGGEGDEVSFHEIQ